MAISFESAISFSFVPKGQELSSGFRIHQDFFLLFEFLILQDSVDFFLESLEFCILDSFWMLSGSLRSVITLLPPSPPRSFSKGIPSRFCRILVRISVRISVRDLQNSPRFNTIH